MSFIHYFESNPWAIKALQSVFFIFIIFGLRAIVNFALEKNQSISSDFKLRWKVHIRNFSLGFLILGLFFIWSAELKTLALSLVAVAVALIIATKELVMCLTGTLFKASSGAFAIGDRIITGEFRGEVIDQTLLSTTLMEIGPGKEMHQLTGRAITLPNSIFITLPVINESYRQNYVLHGFTIPIKLTANFSAAIDMLLQVANEVCKPYLAEAERQLVTAARRRGVDAPSIEPRVSLSLVDAESINMVIRVPAPVKRRGTIEQAIVQKFLHSYLQTVSGTGISK